ncbi:hypothetical protein LINGRAHAP2_LOCUS23120 [Linum grandiflorum]
MKQVNGRDGPKNVTQAGLEKETCPSSLIILSWNCRALGQLRAVQELSELIKIHRPDVVFLAKTFVDKQKMEKIRSEASFEMVFYSI